MLPVIQLGSLELSTYWLTLCVGSMGMLAYTLNTRQAHGLSVWKSIWFTFGLTAVGVLGAKLLFVLENIQDTLDSGVSLGGFSFYGSVFLIALMMPFIGALFSLSKEKTMDICGPCVAIMIGCMRVGCFLQGCCGGKLVDMGGISVRFPVQALESIGDFAILLLLMKWEQENKHRGLLYPLFMLLYSVMRFLLEFLRDTPKDWLLLSHGQWFAICAVIISSIWCVRNKGNTN